MSWPMSEHQREAAFLKQCLLYAENAECEELGEGISKAQRNERCVRRAVWLMAVLTALAIAGLCYAAVFLTDSPQDATQFLGLRAVKIFCALGIGSLIS